MPQDPEGSTSLILIKPGTMNWVPGRIKMYSVSCITRKSLLFSVSKVEVRKCICQDLLDGKTAFAISHYIGVPK